MINLVALQGRLARPPEQRLLPSGTVLLSLELTIPRPEARAETVPVAWFDAPATASGWGADLEVVVVGRVRRRFFKAGGVTQSRTEVVAEAVVPVTMRKRAHRLISDAVAALESAAAGSG